MDEPREPWMREPDGSAIRVISREASRELDRRATEDYAIPSILLMENAAVHLAQFTLDLLGERRCTRVVVLCGCGNNGGDGLALARHLHNAGVEPRVLLASGPDHYRADAAMHLETAGRMGLVAGCLEGLDDDGIRELIGPAEGLLIVDALLGSGLDRPLGDPLARLVSCINELGRGGAAVLAVDVPTGLDADSGEPLGASVRADLTVTFVGIKPGFATLGAQEYIGEIAIADIGAPRELAEELGEELEVIEHPDSSEPQRPEQAPSLPGEREGA